MEVELATLRHDRSKLVQLRRVAKGVAIAPPQFRKVASKNILVNKRLTCKPKKYFSANQRNCSKEPVSVQLLVEPD